MEACSKVEEGRLLHGETTTVCHYDMDAQLDNRMKSLEMQTASLDGRCCFCSTRQRLPARSQVSRDGKCESMEVTADVLDETTNCLSMASCKWGIHAT